MSVPCPTCQPIDCDNTEDEDLYSIESPLYPFVLNCPPGFDCGSDTFEMVCCGQLLSVQIPVTATVDDRATLIQGVINQCGVRQLYCGDLPQLPPGTPIQLYYNVPKQCTVLCPDGSSFVYIVDAGTFLATTQAEADANAASFACVQAGLRKVCLGSIVSLSCLGSAYSQAIPHTGGVPPFSWSVSGGSLPTGLTLNQSGVISGTPTVISVYNFTIRLSESHGSATRSYSIQIHSCSAITLSVVPLSWNPGDTINYIGFGPSFPGDTIRIDWTATDWDGRGSSKTGHFNDLGGVFDGSGNATITSLRLMRRIFTSLSGKLYWGAGPCTLQIEDTDQSPSVFSNTLNRTVNRHAPVSIDAPVLAYILANPDLIDPYVPTGTLTEEFYDNGIGGPLTPQFEDTGTAVGNQTIGAPKGILYSPNGVDLVVTYAIAISGGHGFLTYTKLGSSISNPAGVYSVTSDPNGDAPATCTVT